MYERFTDRAKQVIEIARKETGLHGSVFITPVFIMLGLLKVQGSVARQALIRANQKTISDIEQMIRIPLGKRSGFILSPCSALPKTCKRLIRQAGVEARTMGDNFIGTEHLLLGANMNGDQVLDSVFGELGFTYGTIKQLILQVRSARPPCCSNKIF